MSDVCRHCGKVIMQAHAPEPYWFHPRGQTVYCYPDSPTDTTRAEPRPKALTPT